MTISWIGYYSWMPHALPGLGSVVHFREESGILESLEIALGDGVTLNFTGAGDDAIHAQHTKHPFHRGPFHQTHTAVYLDRLVGDIECFFRTEQFAHCRSLPSLFTPVDPACHIEHHRSRRVQLGGHISKHVLNRDRKS